ncbi:AI-2E family transporter [Streptomyces sp. A7024]|uniref:AI-2E family transporter n=1 Tax=Streptomyces coryli TaxID=1128680 RepID=A0A6G4TUG4_9ACTN|nr:AI-2E family transporter [Streptomyces coryli]NGN62631.1 AI-2E family transporter [Streptomyces coryli]
MRGAPGRLNTAGTAAWMFTGLVAASGLVLFILTVLRPLLLPLVIAAALATVLLPLVDALAARRVPRAAGALLGCLLVIGILLFSAIVFVAGLVDQTDDIGAMLDEAGTNLAETAGDLGIGEQQATDVHQAIEKAAPTVLSAMLSGLADGAAATLQLVLGCTLGLYMLFFLLKDAGAVRKTVVQVIPLRPPLADQAVTRSAALVRRYFAGMTLIGLVNAVLTAVGALILQVESVLAIAVLTFILAYVPYIGALVSGAFAVLLALGSGGTTTAIWMLLIVLLANGALQNMIQPFALGAALRMHPLVVLLATVAAGVFAGVAGVMMAAPLTAIVLDIRRLIRQASSHDSPPQRP